MSHNNPVSSDEVTKAVKILLEKLGAEAAKGLIYWATFKGADAISMHIASLVQKYMTGQSPSPQEIEQLKQLLMKQQTPQLNTDELARIIAEKIQQQMSKPVTPQPPAPYPPQQYPHTAGYPPYLEERRRRLSEDLSRYRNILAELEAQYYKEFDEAKRQEIKRRIEELRDKIARIETELAAPIY